MCPSFIHLQRCLQHCPICISPFQSLSDCREIYHNKENDGWIEYKYEAHFDPRWNGSEIQSEDDVPSFVTILSDPHTRYRYRQVVLVSKGNQGRKDLLAKHLILLDLQLTSGKIYQNHPN